MKPPWVKFALDLLAWTAVVPVAFLLRLETIPARYLPALILYLGMGIPIKAGALYVFGLHRQAWSQVGVPDLWRLVECVLSGTTALFVVGLLLNRWVPFPRSVPVIGGGLAVLALGGMRFGARLWRERTGRRRAGPTQRVLVVGAGEAGTMIVREMLRHPEAGLVPVGFLDDDPAKQRQRFLGLPVLGKLDALPQAVEKCKADEVLIAIPSAPGQVVRQVVERARESGVRHRIIPGIYEILSGKVAISQIREVDLEDLLRREPVRLDLEEIAGYLAGREVLVTGAGGSIGSEIVRQVARFRPREVLLLGRGENSLFELEEGLKHAWPGLRYQVLVADVRDRDRMEDVFRRHRPQVVFHAAAHKHVPLMELNPSEAVVNNVVGTKNLVELALTYGVERFVNISTDKVVNPTSVMGATKRVAEYVVQWAARRARPGQAFVSVRFGNVLGSRGSVVPLFRAQIRRGGPVTVTHPDMRRYFMTIPEAAQLVLQAGGLGENGAVYVLDMGEPIRIVDLAQDLIRLSGFEPDVDIRVEFTGVRPGEKLFEEILTAEEGTVASRHEKIYVARGNAPADAELEAKLATLLAAARSYDGNAIRRALKALVSTYQPGTE
ncbi:MAG: polysaccharide biosynthesis protein [Candidatus Acetothermia bacterium]|jgi:FlaA1/EpsC-like NDP-sugar epimerase|nr:polysaccharide biosynthesis protein [Candidatus Acetothermia bacterium]